MYLERTNIARREPVPESVELHYAKISEIRLLPAEDVYNMEVEKYHNFSVNGGLIVHNCIDSVRYALSPVWRRRGL